MATTKKTTTAKTDTTTAKAVKNDSAKLSIPVYDLTGKSAGSLAVSSEIFGTKVNKVLIAQAVRVYLTNQRAGTANTKTRGEVRGGGKKPFKQKGTGNARQGSKRSPIFVGGGTVFGPQSHEFSQTMPKKMRLKALSCALSQKLNDQKIIALKGLDTLPAKTAKFAKVIESLPKSAKYVLVLDQKRSALQLGVRNLPNIETKMASDLTTYNLINNSTLIVTSESLQVLTSRWK